MQNYYDILGVSRNATAEEIRAAYRKLAKKYHPDSSGSHEDKERFQRIQEAYMVLSDDGKRQTYDYYGHDAYRSSYFAQHSRNARPHSHKHAHKGRGGGQADGHCENCGHSHTDSSCENCGHSRADGSCESCGHSPADGHCENCGHSHTNSQDEWEDYKHVVRVAVWLEIEETFQDVVKNAFLSEQPNDGCSPEKRWSFRVKIPAKSYEKQTFPLEDVILENAELLQHLSDSYPGNRYVVVVLLREKPGYTRQAYHLYFDYPIDFHTLVLGGPIQISCVTGDFTFQVPPGTSLERKLRIPNMGLNYPPEIGNRGDLYLNLRLKIPKNLTDAQKTILEALRDAM